MKHKSLVNKILEHSGDAIIVISMDGVILSANQEALELLEFSEEELVGKSYYWFFFNQTQNQKLGEMINDGFHKSIEHSLEDGTYVTPAGAEKPLKVSTALLKDKPGFGALSDRESLVVFMKLVGTESGESREQTADPVLIRRLQNELEKTKAVNAQLSFLFNKFDYLKLLAVAAVFALFSVLLIFGKNSINLFPVHVAAVSDDARQGTVVAARVDTMEKKLLLTGLIEPYSKVTIAAHTSGRVVRRRFQEGDFVREDEILYQMDTQELAKSVRSARVKYIELLEEYNNLARWDSSLVVMQAKRKFQLSKIALDNEKKKLEETKKLFDKGIIPRVEYEKEMTDYKKAEFDYENAKQALESELAKGSADNLQVVKLKLDNAREELEEIEARYEAKLIRAPVSGIIMRPELGDGKTGEFKNEGDEVKDGDLVATIGATSTFVINSILGELSVNEISVDDTVVVTGPSMPGIRLKGIVAWIGTAASSESGELYYPIRITLSDVPDSIRRAIRIGMRAQAEITTARLDSIVTIPIEAIYFKNGKPTVSVVDETGEYQERKVEVGLSDPWRVQIRAGLEAGEKVLIASRSIVPVVRESMDIDG